MEKLVAGVVFIVVGMVVPGAQAAPKGLKQVCASSNPAMNSCPKIKQLCGRAKHCIEQNKNDSECKWVLHHELQEYERCLRCKQWGDGAMQADADCQVAGAGASASPPNAPPAVADPAPVIPNGCQMSNPSIASELYTSTGAGSCDAAKKSCKCTYSACVDPKTAYTASPYTNWVRVSDPGPDGKPRWRYCTERRCQVKENGAYGQPDWVKCWSSVMTP